MIAAGLTQDTNISIGLLFAALGAAGVIYTIYSSRKRDDHATASEDTEEKIKNAVEFTRINTLLDCLAKQITDLFKRDERRNEKINSIENQYNDLRSKVDLLFDYKDRHDLKLDQLEKEIQDGKSKNGNAKSERADSHM